ncbi:MAG: DNA-directed RNA polymerase subunit alpha [Candidatus Aureabacteria bacterium]|nr:DNA-directed RNA polymerase subunit alpha [Candidatus Auribacterota bacterium]
MAVKLGRFEMPKRLTRDESTMTDTYGKFVAEPFERGYGYTIGNSLRRVLLSSLEGAAITAIKIEGVQHEFATVKGVLEDVTQILLNLKKVLLISDSRETKKISLSVSKEGEIKAGAIKTDGTIQVVNPDLHIATLEKGGKLAIEMDVEVGRGYRLAEENKKKGQPIGYIPMDSIFSPVKKVKYFVENTRIGQMTDYDKLIVEVWVDGRISPAEALKQSSAILRAHLDVFVNYDDSYVEFEEEDKEIKKEEHGLKTKLDMPITEIELSVRSTNCLSNANINTICELVSMTEAELLKQRNFGKKSLNEIKAVLKGLELSLGMKTEVIAKDK